MSDQHPGGDNISYLRGLEDQQEALRRALQTVGDGGNGGGMEARIAKLEAHVEHIRSDLAKLATVPMEIAVLKTRVDALPTKGFIVTSAVGTVGAVVGLLTLLAKVGLLGQ